MNLQDKISGLLGEEVQLTLPLSEHHLGGCVPQVVAAPRNVDAARELVTWCGRERWRWCRAEVACTGAGWLLPGPWK